MVRFRIMRGFKTVASVSRIKEKKRFHKHVYIQCLIHIWFYMFSIYFLM